MNPPIPSLLMAWLKENYPPRCRLPNETEREHERYAGRVELVAELEEKFKDQVAPNVTTKDLLQGVTFEELYQDQD